jgi:hypothetical protein
MWVRTAYLTTAATEDNFGFRIAALRWGLDGFLGCLKFLENLPVGPPSAIITPVVRK